MQTRQLYAQYLRILDAIHEGVNFAEIGEVLTPGAINDPVLKERDKRTRAAHDAALKVQQEGYKGLLERDPPFNKK